MIIIMFAGAGSVGKTKLLEACLKMAQERGLKATSHFSTTRDTYAKEGLHGESCALADAVSNIQFQHKVMTNNVNALQQTAKQALADGMDVIFTDRSPYDYSSYFFTVFQDTLTLKTIFTKRQESNNAILDLLSLCIELKITMLPYPGVWSQDTQSSDGWRADKTGKNFLWSSVVESELTDGVRRLNQMPCSGGLLTVARLVPFIERGSVEVRAAGVMAAAFPNLH